MKPNEISSGSHGLILFAVATVLGALQWFLASENMIQLSAANLVLIGIAIGTDENLAQKIHDEFGNAFLTFVDCWVRLLPLPLGDPRVFISYSHADAAVVKKLVRRLSWYGAVGFLIDFMAWKPGDNLHARIDRAVAETHSAFICIGSNGIIRTQKVECRRIKNRLLNDASYCVAFILLPGGNEDMIPSWAKKIIYADLRHPGSASYLQELAKLAKLALVNSTPPN